MVNNAFVEPAVKERVEALLSGGVAFNDFLNALLVEFIEENNIGTEQAEFDRKMQLALDNDPNPPSFFVRTKEELAAKLKESKRDFEEGRTYSLEEVIEELNREYGYSLSR